MFKNVLLTNVISTTCAGLSLTILFPHISLASTFYIQQKDDSGEIALSGQFSGEDADNSLSLSLDELTRFDLNLYGNPKYTLDDFGSFFYSLAGDDTINFNAGKFQIINDGNILSLGSSISTDSDSESITSGGDVIYFADGRILVSDLFLDEPVQISSSRIPEGDNIFALSILGAFALLQKTSKYFFKCDQ